MWYSKFIFYIVDFVMKYVLTVCLYIGRWGWGHAKECESEPSLVSFTVDQQLTKTILILWCGGILIIKGYSL